MEGAKWVDILAKERGECHSRLIKSQLWGVNTDLFRDDDDDVKKKKKNEE